MQRILLVEDHASFRQTLAYIFDGEPDFEVVAQAGSLAEARRTAVGGGADLGVIDLTLPDGEGVELIRELREANDEFAALILTASVDKSEHARAVEAGAAGVVHKSANVDEILDATRRLAAGETPPPPQGAAGPRPRARGARETLLSQREIVGLLRLAGQAREEERVARASIGQITPREREVLQTLAEGLSHKEIAARPHMGGAH